MYHFNTSTGTACHLDLPSALENGILECIERDAFSKFWYFQTYHTQEPIHEHAVIDFFKNKYVNLLFENKNVRLVTYDISNLSYCHTFVVFLLFNYKGKIMISLGASSKLLKLEAIIKACLEAYQGINYTIQLLENNIFFDESKIYNYDFSEIDNFSKHFLFYNRFPSFRKEVPIIKNLFDKDYKGKFVKNFNKKHINSINKKELNRVGINHLYYSDISTIDVKKTGSKVIKTVIPQLSLLTGNHNYPYLGNYSDEKKKLFLDFPHPFP